MLKITVEGNKEEIKKAKNEIDGCCFISKNCSDPNMSCKECEKGKIEIKYVLNEDK